MAGPFTEPFHASFLVAGPHNDFLKDPNTGICNENQRQTGHAGFLRGPPQFSLRRLCIWACGLFNKGISNANQRKTGHAGFLRGPLTGPLNFLCAASAYGLVDCKIQEFQIKNERKTGRAGFLRGPPYGPP